MDMRLIELYDMIPSNSLIASANESIVSISRWLVGSSNNNKWGAINN